VSKRLDYNQIAPAGLKALGRVHGYVAQSSLPQSAVPPSLSEATHGPWHEMSLTGLSDAATFPPKRQMTEEKSL
jgi:hypothetical protein